MKDIIAKLENITKIYTSENPETGEVYKNIALNGADIEFKTSEIHALLGDNGAGKSTLVHIFSGLQMPSAGSIKIDNKDYYFSSPAKALQAGISIVHQAPNLITDTTVFENILIGLKQNSLFSVINRKNIKHKIKNIFSDWGISLDIESKVKNISVQDKFYTAFIAAIYREPRFLILDEPSAVISKNGKKEFLKKLRRYSKKNKIGIVLITHKFDEALEIADRISILKNGKIENSFFIEELKKENILSVNIFDDIINPHLSADENICTKNQNVNKHYNINNSCGLEILIACRDNSADCIHADKIIYSKIKNADEYANEKKFSEPIIFFAKKNNITGIAGMQESKIENLENILSGMAEKSFLKTAAGNIKIKYENENILLLPFSKITPQILLKNKIGFIPSDKYYRASNPNLSIEQVLCCYYLKNRIKDKEEIRKFAVSILARENIKTDAAALCGSLSGGQLQRILLARCLEEKPDILILSEPAKGLDSASSLQLKIKLKEFAGKGGTVLVLTKEMETEIYKSLFDEIYYVKDNIF